MERVHSANSCGHTLNFGSSPVSHAEGFGMVIRDCCLFLFILCGLKYIGLSCRSSAVLICRRMSIVVIKVRFAPLPDVLDTCNVHLKAGGYAWLAIFILRVTSLCAPFASLTLDYGHVL
jgi:hypothetical protein